MAKAWVKVVHENNISCHKNVKYKALMAIKLVREYEHLRRPFDWIIVHCRSSLIFTQIGPVLLRKGQGDGRFSCVFTFLFLILVLDFFIASDHQ